MVILPWEDRCDVPAVAVLLMYYDLLLLEQFYHMLIFLRLHAVLSYFLFPYQLYIIPCYLEKHVSYHFVLCKTSCVYYFVNFILTN